MDPDPQKCRSEDELRATREVEFKKLPYIVRTLIQQMAQGVVVSIEMLREVLTTEPWFVWYLLAVQDDKTSDARKIANRHKHFKLYLDAGGKVKELKGYRISPPAKGSKVPTITTESGELINVAANTATPNPESAESPWTLSNEEDLNLSGQNPASPVYVQHGNGNSGWVAAVGILIVVILAIVWGVGTGFVQLGDHSPAATAPSAANTVNVMVLIDGVPTQKQGTLNGDGTATVIIDGQTKVFPLFDAGASPNLSPAPSSGAPVGDVATCPSDAFILSGQMFGYNAALLREASAPAEYCLFETNQPKPGESTYTLPSCPAGWECEMDTVGPGGKLAYGPMDGPFVMDHGSFRLVAAYPSWDPIHFPCTELGNSQGFVDDTSASSGWKVEPVGFTCEDELAPGTPPSSWVTNTCPPDGSAAEVAATLGGLPGEWTIGSDDHGTYWERAANSPSTLLRAPWGKLDVWTGQPPILHFGPNEDSPKSYEATWHCLAQ